MLLLHSSGLQAMSLSLWNKACWVQLLSQMSDLQAQGIARRSAESALEGSSRGRLAAFSRCTGCCRGGSAFQETRLWSSYRSKWNQAGHADLYAAACLFSGSSGMQRSSTPSSDFDSEEGWPAWLRSPGYGVWTAYLCVRAHCASRERGFASTSLQTSMTRSLCSSRSHQLNHSYDFKSLLTPLKSTL